MATTSPNLTFAFSGIGSLLKASRLKVPLNQREYSWEDKQVSDLFQDFSNAIRVNKSGYFLGTVVLSKGTKTVPEVVDGQQRLATTSILLAAIRDYFYNKKEQILQQSIDNDFLVTIDREHKECVSKLTLNVDDNEYFKNRIIALPDSDKRQALVDKTDSHRRISSAAKKAEELIQIIVKGRTERNTNDILNEWIYFIEHKATIIVLTVPDEMNAFMMFETLNDRGLKTSQVDLVKNYLFGESEDRLPEAQQKWSRMSATLEALGIDDIAMTYLRHLAITQFGTIREKEIFAKIQAEISGRSESIAFIDKLSDYAESYAALLTPIHPKWNGYPAQMRDAVTVLKELRVQQIRPLMLAVTQHFDPKEAELAYRMFICWTVRFLIAGGMRGGQLENAYSLCAYEISKGEIKNTKELLDKLVNVIPNDAEFQAAFSTARVSQHYLARYYLRAIEAYLRNESNQPELMPVKDTNILNLEHILPQEPSDNWPHLDSEIAEAYTKRIGNLTLLKTKTNTYFGNASFKVKRAEFADSQLLITRTIFDSSSDNAEWGAESINARQKKLAEYAVKTWPLSLK